MHGKRTALHRCSSFSQYDSAAACRRLFTSLVAPFRFMVRIYHAPVEIVDYLIVRVVIVLMKVGRSSSRCYV